MASTSGLTAATKGVVARARSLRSPSPITLTWSETRVAPASRALRSSASTAVSTASAPPSAVLPNGPTSTASSSAAWMTSRATSACAGASSRSKGSVVNSTLNRTMPPR